MLLRTMKIRADPQCQGNVKEFLVDGRQRRICRPTHMPSSTFENFGSSDAKEPADSQESQGTEQAVAVDFKPFKIPSQSPKCGIQTSKFNIHKITRQPTTYNLHTQTLYSVHASP